MTLSKISLPQCLSNLLAHITWLMKYVTLGKFVICGGFLLFTLMVKACPSIKCNVIRVIFVGDYCQSDLKWK